MLWQQPKPMSNKYFKIWDVYGKILRPLASVMKWCVPGQRWAHGSQDTHPTGGKRCHGAPPSAHVLSDVSLNWHGKPTDISKIAAEHSHGPAHLTLLILLPILMVTKHITFPISSRRADTTNEPQNLYNCISGLLHPPWMVPHPQKMPELCGAASWGNQAKAASSAPLPLMYAGTTTGPYDVNPELAYWLTAGFLPFYYNSLWMPLLGEKLDFGRGGRRYFVFTGSSSYP